MENIESLKMMLLARNISCYVFWKDKELRYQGGNDSFLKTLGFSSINEVIGKTDYDFPWAADAEEYRRIDQLVLAGKTILNSKEVRWHVNGPHTVIVNKLPMKDEKGNIVGVLGIHQDYNTEPTELLEKDIVSSTHLAPQSESELFSTLKNISNVLLTRREMECLSLWLSGHSIKESSYCLNISQKSIEAYRKHIKDKMGVHHKFQLIDLMESKGAFHLFLTLGKLIQNKSQQAHSPKYVI